jgi:hypothetical protein
MPDRYLTKSKFKVALECPTKLFYVGKKEEYYNSKIDDAFLKSLAKGGFQIGELAKHYFPGGINIDHLDHDLALNDTDALLKKEEVIIYEAAFKFNNLFIRADVIVKNKDKIKIYEVKAKSIDSEKESFTNSKGEIMSEWKPFIYDIAFQKHVICKSNPDLAVESFLMLVDTSTQTSVEGLNQRFFIKEESSGQIKIIVSESITTKELGNRILTTFPLDETIEKIYSFNNFENSSKSFEELILTFEAKFVADELIIDGLGSKCHRCEFQIPASVQTQLKDGRKECWKRIAEFKPADFQKPSILNLWNFRKKDEYIRNKKYFQSDLHRVDLEPASKPKVQPKTEGMNYIDRQELQIKKSKNNDSTLEIDIENIRSVANSWTYPLHFIDFETTMVAIPFNSGRRPYELIAFQFSHHVFTKDGTIEHTGQWFNYARGNFPNFDFVRALKEELSKDSGTIFRYATHENTVLNTIHRQLSASNQADKQELCQWIEEITELKKSKDIPGRIGKRNMVDLHDLVLRYHYDPSTNGSNSLKNILVSLINSSDFLKNKYSKPIYGKEIKSLNFTAPRAWVVHRDGVLIDPYELLPRIFPRKDFSLELLDRLVLDEDSGIQDGGAAMIAYAQMQFSQMSEEERNLVRDALLKYCELDTLAMIMLWEHWNHLLAQKIN